MGGGAGIPTYDINRAGKTSQVKYSGTPETIIVACLAVTGLYWTYYSGIANIQYSQGVSSQ